MSDGNPDHTLELQSPIEGPIQDKAQLIAYLQEASEIEQQLMIQYLYAAFSMKKRPDATCNDAQFEFVRRWTSTVLMVGRQEMEHLALVNGLLTALGAEPYFDRENIPLQSRYFQHSNLAARSTGNAVQPCDIPFVFERFNLATIGRFVCMESPGYDVLVKSGDPIPWWCFGTAEHPCGGPRNYRLARTRLLAAAQNASSAEFFPGTIQKLYDDIELGLNQLSRRENLFTGNPSRQVFVPVEYQINIFPITDLNSALTALHLIVEEGEGIDAPPLYPSHFRRFLDVHAELVAELARDPSFEPSMPVPLNPAADRITDPFARRLFDLFNYSYTTLVLLLTSLYKNYVPTTNQSYPYLSAALQETAFGPVMTMLLRPIAEVMAYTRSGDGETTTAPNYHLSAKDAALLQNPKAPEFTDIDFFLNRFTHIVTELDALSADHVAAHARAEGDVPFVRRQLRFVAESATAMGNNMRRIYQIGQYGPFVVT
jgi:hypothetical protein